MLLASYTLSPNLTPATLISPSITALIALICLAKRWNLHANCSCNPTGFLLVELHTSTRSQSMNRGLAGFAGALNNTMFGLFFEGRHNTGLWGLKRTRLQLWRLKRNFCWLGEQYTQSSVCWFRWPSETRPLKKISYHLRQRIKLVWKINEQNVSLMNEF